MHFNLMTLVQKVSIVNHGLVKSKKTTQMSLKVFSIFNREFKEKIERNSC